MDKEATNFGGNNYAGNVLQVPCI